MTYYHDLVTQKSWEELTRLTKLVPCVLIGGWAVYLYTKRLKSKDIDILVDFDALSILKDHYSITRNERLKKYQATRDMVEIDIYLPHFSKIGIPVEDLTGKTRGVEGFTVLDPDYLCALKLFTLGERRRTPKGRKDFFDILSLFLARVVDENRVKHVVKTYQLGQSLGRFGEFLSEFLSIPQLNLTVHTYAALKRDIEKQLSLKK